MDKNQIIDQAVSALLKWWTWAAWILIGLGGKIGYNLYHGEKMSSWKFIGSTMVACFVGYIASVFCATYCPEKASLIVPVSTLASDRIIMGIMAMNWWGKAIEFITNASKKEEK